MVIDYLVFEGGGIKGLAYIGVLEEMQKMCDISSIQGFAGTSAGSIIATFLAVGMSVEQIKTILFNNDFSKLIPTNTWQVAIVYNIFNNYGYVDDNHFMRFLEKHLPKDYTLKELWDERQKELIIVGSDLNTRTPVYFSYKNYPDIKISELIRISMSIPFIFKPINYKGNLFTDGGSGDNYPLDYMKNTKKDSNVIGIRFLKRQDRYAINNIGDYINALLTVSVSNGHNYDNDPNSITIDVGNLDSLYFVISHEKKRSLLASGRDAYHHWYESTKQCNT